MPTNEHLHSIEEIKSIMTANLKKVQKSNCWYHWGEKNCPSVYDTDTFLVHSDLYTVYESPIIDSCYEVINSYMRRNVSGFIDILVNPMTHKLDIYFIHVSEYILYHDDVSGPEGKVYFLAGNLEHEDAIRLAYNYCMLLSTGNSDLPTIWRIRSKRRDLSDTQVIDVLEFIQCASVTCEHNAWDTILLHYANQLFPIEAISDR